MVSVQYLGLSAKTVIALQRWCDRQEICTVEVSTNTVTGEITVLPFDDQETPAQRKRWGNFVCRLAGEVADAW